MPVENDSPAFQVRRLPAHEPWMTGTLVYPDVFWELDCVGLREDPAEESSTTRQPGRLSDAAAER
ncbi:MAG TPA: hypothetical protein VFJ12_14755 [Segeticoccus sp.]|nr:hypothetical protein [Segeticoccus sp.]